MITLGAQAARCAWALLGLALLPGCMTRFYQTHHYPGPMEPLVDPLPRGQIPPPPYGPQEILVFRLSDPVQVRRAGEASAYPLAVYEKRERLRSGSSVLCAAGGRCELLWPNDASSVVVFDEGVLDLGEPSRDEPFVSFRTVTRARLDLTPEDRVGLMGGAVLRGDSEERSGPFLVEHTRGNVLRVTNQSKRACTVAFREEELVLSPGEVLTLPLLEAGGTPSPRDPEEVALSASGREVFVVGKVTEDGSALRASGSAVIRDRGVTVRLADGEAVVLEALLQVVQTPGAGAPPEDLPQPARGTPAAPAAAAPPPVGEPAAEAPAPAPEATPPAAEEPATTGDEPATTGEEPPTTGEEPPATGEEPPATGEEPPVTGEEPPVTDEPPAAGEEHPPAGDPPPPADEPPAPVGEEHPPAGDPPAPAGEEPPPPGQGDSEDPSPSPRSILPAASVIQRTS